MAAGVTKKQWEKGADQYSLDNLLRLPLRRVSAIGAVISKIIYGTCDEVGYLVPQGNAAIGALVA